MVRNYNARQMVEQTFTIVNLDSNKSCYEKSRRPELVYSHHGSLRLLSKRQQKDCTENGRADKKAQKNEDQPNPIGDQKKIGEYSKHVQM